MTTNLQSILPMGLHTFLLQPLRSAKNTENEKKTERSKMQMLGEYQAQKWDMERETQHYAAMVDLQRGKQQKMQTGQGVVLPYELSRHLTLQMVLQPKGPRFLSDDMVFTLLVHGRSLELMDEMRPLFRTYSTGNIYQTNSHQTGTLGCARPPTY